MISDTPSFVFQPLPALFFRLYRLHSFDSYALHEVIPKVVANAVSTLIAICRIVFQVSFFILFSF